MRRIIIRNFGIILGLGLAMGCGSTHQAAWDEGTTSGVTSDRDRLVEEGNAAWAGRDDEAQVLIAIERWEGALSIDADDPELWVSVARARYFLADCHIRFDETREEEFRATYQASTQDAERALVQMSPDFASRMRDGSRIEEAIEVLDESAVPALYWRSSALGKWASAEGFATLLSYKDEIRAVMSFCLEQDEDYYYAGPHRYFGVFFARAPAFAGGDLEQSREHFDTTLRMHTNYFASHVLFAQDYATKAQDRELFTRELQWVLDADAESIPEIAPENRCEQRKARSLITEADERF